MMRTLLASLRFATFFGATFGFYGLWLSGTLLMRRKPGWRTTVFGWWARSFIFISGMKVTVMGKIPEPPFFLVSNHLGYIDVPTLKSQLDAIFVSKSEVQGWPIAGRIIRDMGTIFIDRKNHRDIPKAGENILRAIENGQGVIIFPEGTSGSGRELMVINSSFLEFPASREMPVHVVTISYSTRDGDPPASNSIAWWDATPFSRHLFNFFKLRGPMVRIQFADRPLEERNRKVLAKRIAEEMERIFIPMK